MAATIGTTKTEERHSCSEVLYSSARGRSRCSNPGSVARPVGRMVYPKPVQVYDEATFTFHEESGGESHRVEEQKWFCRTHDPVRIAERQNKKNAEHDAERAAQEKRREDVTVIAARVGGGPTYERGRGYTGSITLWRERATKIADVLDAARVMGTEYGTLDGRNTQELVDLLNAALAALDAK